MIAPCGVWVSVRRNKERCGRCLGKGCKCCVGKGRHYYDKSAEDQMHHPGAETYFRQSINGRGFGDKMRG